MIKPVRVPPSTMPVAEKLKSELSHLDALYLLNVNSTEFQSELAKLVRRCPKNLELITEVTIRPLKTLARLHGLPPEIRNYLLAVFENDSDDDSREKLQFQVSTAHTIKYCVQKNPSYLTAAQMVPILKKYSHKYEEKEKTFLIKELLQELVLIATFLQPSEHEEDRASLGDILRRCWQYLDPENRLSVKSRLENKGFWPGFFPTSTATEFPNDNDAEVKFECPGLEYMESFYKSNRTPHQPLAFVTKEQERLLEAIITEDSEKSETISFNIQCHSSFLTVESRNSVLSSETHEETELRPPSEGESTVLVMWHQFRFTTTNIDLIQDKVNRAPTAVTRDELKYLEDNFYTSTSYCTKEEPEMDRKISQMFNRLSGAVTLEYGTLLRILRQSWNMLSFPKPQPLYTVEDQEIILKNVLAVIARKVVCISHSEFSPMADILTDIRQLLRTRQDRDPKWRSRPEIDGMRQEIWKIFQLKARSDHRETAARMTQALQLLTESTEEHGALEFVIDQIQYGRINVTTWADKLVPAMLKVLMDRSRDGENGSSYSTDEITQALNILQLYFSQEQADLKLNKTQLVYLFDGLLRWQQFERIPYFVVHCVHKQLEHLKRPDSLENLWKALWSCVAHMTSTGPDSFSQRQKAELLIAMQTLLVASKDLNSEHGTLSDYGLSTDGHADYVRFIAGLLGTRAAICSDGDVLENFPQDLDPSVSAGEIHGKPSMSFSSVAAKILLDIQCKHEFDVQVVDAVCEALGDDRDKQTRIYCSEYLHQLVVVSAEAKPLLSLDQLEVLQNYLQDPVADVRVHSRLAYVRSLAKYPPDQIPPHHLYNLPDIYVLNSLRLDDEDFTEQINQPILKIFKNCSQSRTCVRFTTEIYETLAFVLNQKLQDSTPQVESVLEILEMVEESLEKLPWDEAVPPVLTKMGADVFLQMESESPKCVQFLRKIQDRGNWLPAEVLRQCSELVHQDGSSLARKCLSVANFQQDLPEKIFIRFLLDLVGRRFKSGISNPSDALVFLHRYLEKGHLISANNFEVLKSVCLPQESLQEKTIGCLVSASSNGQHLPVAITDAVFTPIESSSTTQGRLLAKQLDLALVLVRSNQTLPPPFLKLVIDKFYDLDIHSFAEPQGRHILDLVTTMIHRNYSLPSEEFSRIAQSLGCLAMEMLKSKDTQGLMMPSNEILPVISCLIERRAVLEPTLIRWKEGLMRAVLDSQNEILNDLPTPPARIVNSPTQISAEEQLQLLDAILKLPETWLTGDDFTKLILKVCSSASGSSSARSLICSYGREHQMEGNLWDVLNLLTKPEDMAESKFRNGIAAYLDYEVDLKLNEVAVKRLEDLLKSSPEASEGIADSLAKMASMATKDRHHLSPLADAVFFAKMDASSEEVMKTCNDIASLFPTLQIPCSFSYNNPVPEESRSQNEDFAGELSSADLAASLELQVLQDEVSWATISIYIEQTKRHPRPSSMDTINKLALKFPTLSQNRLNSRQIRTFIEFTSNFAATTEGSHTLELIQLWNFFLTYEASPVIRKLCFLALASARKAIQTPDLRTTVIEGLWEEICTKKINAVYQEIFHDSADNILSQQIPSFSEQLACTLYSLDTWNLAPLREIPTAKWINHLLFSDLVEKYAQNETERIHMFLLVKRHVDAGGNVQMLADYVSDKVEEASEIFSLTGPRMIELLTSQISRINWFRPHSLKNVQLKSVILPALEGKIRDKMTSSAPKEFTAMLAERMLEAARNNYKVAEKLLDHLKEIEDGRILFHVLNLLKNDNLAQEQFHHRLPSLSAAMTAGEMKASILTHTFLALLPDIQASPHYFSVEGTLKTLFARNYVARSLQSLFHPTLESSEPNEVKYLQVDHILHQLCQYDIDYQSFAAHIDQITAQGPAKMSERLNHFVQSQLHGLSSQETAKSCLELVSELYQLNPKIERIRHLEEIITQITASQPLTESEIGNWAAEMRHSRKIHVTRKTVAVITRAFKMIKDWNLTVVQVMSIVLALCKLDDKIQLQQVSTGSGKSAIIAAVAVARALEGHKVDIYTSSPVLAQRDAKEWSGFYKLFGLTCSYNVERGSGHVKGLKKCYRSDIVYGDMAQFQFDTLREEYSGLGTRGSREFGYALVDEVDSMCIDDCSKLAQLSSTLPGMDLLQIVYHFIWNHLQGLHSQLSYVNGKLFFKQEPDFQELEPVEDIESFMKTRLQDYIRSVICNPKGHLNLPKHIRKYAETQISNWADSAIIALTFHENEHYVIDEGQIKPVDFMTTGVVQSSTNWNNGLHPFLQIKHSLRVTPETITTNFMSNKAMLSKYGSNIVGFTGTLGSEESKAVLQNAYNAESIIIPETYYKRFKRLQDLIVSSDAEWTEKIVFNSVHEAMKNRAVLVICQTIKDAEFLARELRRYKVAKYTEFIVKLYVRNDRSQESHIERVHPKDIIVATNLGTRGMDIKAGDVEPYGGLHVILTYLPESLRVEEQAFGRTSRQGNRGTGQLIIARIFDQHVGSIRNEKESRRLEHFVTHDLPLIELKDELFGKFCKLFSETRDQLRRHSTVSTLDIKVWKLCTRWQELSTFDHIVLDAIEEQWAILLKSVDDDFKENHRNSELCGFDYFSKLARERYDELQVHIQRNHRNLDVLFSQAENCFYWIRMGNELYKRFRGVENNAKASTEYFKNAALPHNSTAPAFLGLAAAELFSSRQTPTDRETALKYLESAMSHTQSEIFLYQNCQQLIKIQANGRNTELQRQLERRLEILGEYLQNIANIHNNVTRSIRRLFCTAKNAVSSKMVRVPHESCDLPMLDGCTYRLQFHNLTSRSDLNTVDQATEIVTTAFSKSCRVFEQNFSVILRVPSTENVKLGFAPLVTAASSAKLSVYIEGLIDSESFDLAQKTARAASLEVKLKGDV